MKMHTEEQKKQLEQEEQKIDENLQRMKHRIVVFSGKGGVGKTKVSVNLAFGLSLLGYHVGLLDADITGPNVPKMLAISSEVRGVGNRLIPHECLGVKVMSIAGMLQPDQPVIWRGPLRSKLLNHCPSIWKPGNRQMLASRLS
jgi:ATP-binding protein involved in chromosome partitioning